MNLEQKFQNLNKIILPINNIYSTHKMNTFNNNLFINQICFVSKTNQWGFTLNTFSSFYSSKFGITKEKLVQKFWGEYYFNTKNYYIGKNRKTIFILKEDLINLYYIQFKFYIMLIYYQMKIYINQLLIH